jgi:hypothetical protein
MKTLRLLNKDRRLRLLKTRRKIFVCKKLKMSMTKRRTLKEKTKKALMEIGRLVDLT